MLITETRNLTQNHNKLSQIETIPTLREIRRRVREIRNSWSRDEKALRSVEGQQRLDALASSLGLIR